MALITITLTPNPLCLYVTISNKNRPFDSLEAEYKRLQKNYDAVIGPHAAYFMNFCFIGIQVVFPK